MDAELAIVGGGLAGLALANAVRSLPATLLAAEDAAPPAPAGSFDSRVYALTPGNVAFLESIGVWRRLSMVRVAPVRTMRVFGDAAGSGIAFDAYRAGTDALAWIVEDGALQAALRGALADAGRVTLRTGARLERLEIEAAHANLRLQGGRTLRARLVVGADGADSAVRTQAEIEADRHPYPQRAVVANFACMHPQPGVAFQWFQGGPVLALLPLPDGQASMVWSTGEAHAAQLLGLAPEALCREVGRASGGVLGGLELRGPARAFALQRLVARRAVAPRVALVGDAAHVIHPLAGQGANLGLQDARRLAEVLDAREPGRDPGDLRLLRRYERARAEDVLAMQATVHGLWRLFGAHGAGWSRLRNAGLNLTDRLPVLKNLLIRRAMA
ncbi:MAG: FAD-dependent monooxygenase [Burkholderiales bacterium]